MKTKNEILAEIKFDLIKKHNIDTLDDGLINDCVEMTLKAINYSQCWTQLKDKVKLTFDEYTEKFYISNGFTYESKRTGKLADINEITERYRWYSKYL